MAPIAQYLRGPGNLPGPTTTTEWAQAEPVPSPLDADRAPASPPPPEVSPEEFEAKLSEHTRKLRALKWSDADIAKEVTAQREHFGYAPLQDTTAADIGESTAEGLDIGGGAGKFLYEGLKLYSTPGGEIRRGIAGPMGLTRPEDEAKIKQTGTYPETDEYLGRAGVGPGFIRGALGFVGDMASDVPMDMATGGAAKSLKVAGKLKSALAMAPARTTAKWLGEKAYQAELGPADWAAKKMGKGENAFSEWTYKQGLRGGPDEIYDQTLGKLTALSEERKGVVEDLMRKGAAVNLIDKPLSENFKRTKAALTKALNTVEGKRDYFGEGTAHAGRAAADRDRLVAEELANLLEPYQTSRPIMGVDELLENRTHLQERMKKAYARDEFSSSKEKVLKAIYADQKDLIEGAAEAVSPVLAGKFKKVTSEMEIPLTIKDSMEAEAKKASTNASPYLLSPQAVGALTYSTLRPESLLGRARGAGIVAGMITKVPGKTRVGRVLQKAGDASSRGGRVAGHALETGLRKIMMGAGGMFEEPPVGVVAPVGYVPKEKE